MEAQRGQETQGQTPGVATVLAPSAPAEVEGQGQWKCLEDTSDHWRISLQHIDLRPGGVVSARAWVMGTLNVPLQQR